MESVWDQFSRPKYLVNSLFRLELSVFSSADIINVKSRFRKMGSAYKIATLSYVDVVFPGSPLKSI